MSAYVYTGPIEHGTGTEHDQPASGFAARAAIDLPQHHIASLASHTAHHPDNIQAACARRAPESVVSDAVRQRASLSRIKDISGRHRTIRCLRTRGCAESAIRRVANSVDARC